MSGAPSLWESYEPEDECGDEEIQTDIVERIRAASRTRESYLAWSEYDEAADEIERLRMTEITWSAKERAVIDELMASQQLSERAVIRQALAHYQIACRKAHGTYVSLGSKLPDAKLVQSAPPPYPFCRTPDKCAGKGYCPKDIACND